MPEPAVMSATAKATRGSDTTPSVTGQPPMLPVGNSRYCLCRGCAQYFLSVRAFEKHRVVGPADKRACMSTPRMRDAGLELDPRGFWRFPKRKFRNIYLRAVS